MILRRNRKAFTLVELILVIAILVLLLAMLLPSIQRVRHASEIMLCKSNLHQIGIALHHYHNDYRVLPPGCSGPDKKEPLPFLGWPARLLPYMEQDALWTQTVDAFGKDKEFLNNPPHVASHVVVQHYLCPSEELTRRSLAPFMAFTHYLGVSGRDYLKNDGVLYLNSKTKLTDIRDGITNTLMVGERPPGESEAFGWWYAGWGQNKDGSCEVVLGVRELNSFGDPHCFNCPSGPYHFQYGDKYCDFFHFWSRHTGGANFLFADGSVRFLSYSADALLPALASRAGSESVSVPDE